jgi:hypothetical protein
METSDIDTITQTIDSLFRRIKTLENDARMLHITLREIMNNRKAAKADNEDTESL